VKPGAWTQKRMTSYLKEKGITVQSIDTVESTLEDVFTLLAHS
jgi:hypothetical protein